MKKPSTMSSRRFRIVIVSCLFVGVLAAGCLAWVWLTREPENSTEQSQSAPQSYDDLPSPIVTPEAQAPIDEPMSGYDQWSYDDQVPEDPAIEQQAKLHIAQTAQAWFENRASKTWSDLETSRLQYFMSRPLLVYLTNMVDLQTMGTLPDVNETMKDIHFHKEPDNQGRSTYWQGTITVDLVPTDASQGQPRSVDMRVVAFTKEGSWFVDSWELVP